MSKEAIGLSQLVSRVKLTLQEQFELPVWVVAEISDLNINRTGHCYLELFEKDSISDKIIAKTRATIWAFAFRMLKPYFETTTGESFRPGIKVMLKVSVEFHEVFGFSLNVQDIDPNYTLGDMARKRAEILEALENDGVIDMNKLLELPRVPQNIAVISSETAAGYGDFMDQLNNNEYGFQFTIKLFAAVMQGDKTSGSIINALDAVLTDPGEYDAVVIIRGGGSKTDLSSFDDYDLAYFVTQYPLPVITGIGHERDDSVVDVVAHTRLKTPTAVAEFLIEKMAVFYELLNEYSRDVKELTQYFFDSREERINHFSQNLIYFTRNLLDDHRDYLTTANQRLIGGTRHLVQQQIAGIHNKEQQIKMMIHASFNQQNFVLDNHKTRLSKWTRNYLQKKERRLVFLDSRKNALSPENILKRGFAIVTHNEQLIKEASTLKPGDKVNIKLHKGEVETQVNRVKSR